MKKFLISISVLTTFVIVVFGIKGNSVNVNKLKIKKETTESLIECINKEDGKLLKNMFSLYELDKDEDIEQDIELLLEYLGGKIESFGEYENLSEQEMFNHGKMTRYYFGIHMKDIRTKDGKKYDLSYNMSYADDDYPDSIGLESIMLFSGNGDKLFEVGGI